MAKFDNGDSVHFSNDLDAIGRALSSHVDGLVVRVTLEQSEVKDLLTIGPTIGILLCQLLLNWLRMIPSAFSYLYLPESREFRASLKVE